MPINTVGCSRMRTHGSRDRAGVCAQRGYKTLVMEVDQGLLDKGFGRVRRFLDEGVAEGKVTAEARDATLANLTGTTAFAELAGCDLVIEAIVENLEAKRDAYHKLEAFVGPETIFASNTSSLCITELAAATSRPDRFAGLHFFNPGAADEAGGGRRGRSRRATTTHARTFAFAQSLGKEPITAPDRPGFIVNRLLVPYLLDAISAYENGLGTLEDIDKGMKLGCGYPMGPFTLLDFVGLDTTYYIANIMFEEFREPDLRAAAAAEAHGAGRAGWGRRAGEGFYNYQ